ncbi:MAG: hypothetical protein HYW90_00755 [Candidatus Sungbacteria bacterium]|nr:hypothetical protein [Candidatus Sungbacteria bacterium]
MRIFPQEKSAEAPKSPDEILYNSIAQEALAKKIKTVPQKLPLEDILFYMAAQNKMLSSADLAVYERRVRRSLKEATERAKKSQNGAAEREKLKNRKAFFEFAVHKGGEMIAKKGGFKPQNLSGNPEDLKKKELEYARLTLKEYIRLEEDKKLSASHFLNEEFNPSDLTDEDLRIWLKVIEKQVSREELTEYGKTYNEGPQSRRVFRHAINNLLITL